MWLNNIKWSNWNRSLLTKLPKQTWILAISLISCFLLLSVSCWPFVSWSFLESLLSPDIWWPWNFKNLSRFSRNAPMVAKTLKNISKKLKFIFFFLQDYKWRFGLLNRIEKCSFKELSTKFSIITSKANYSWALPQALNILKLFLGLLKMMFDEFYIECFSIY